MRPNREVATNNGQTYFVTSNTVARQCFFRNERWLKLFAETLLSYRPRRFGLHAFTVMPDDFHVLITPVETLEKTVQFIKGGFRFGRRRSLIGAEIFGLRAFRIIGFVILKTTKSIGNISNGTL